MRTPCLMELVATRLSTQPLGLGERVPADRSPVDRSTSSPGTNRNGEPAQPDGQRAASTTSASDPSSIPAASRSRRGPVPGAGRRRLSTRETYPIARRRRPPRRYAPRPMLPAPERWTASRTRPPTRGRAGTRLPHALDALPRRPRPRLRAVGRPRPPRRPGARRFARGRAAVVWGVTAPLRARRCRRRPGRRARHRPAGSGDDFARQLDIPRGDLPRRLTCCGPARFCRPPGRGRPPTAETWFTTVANSGSTRSRTCG